MIERNLSTPDGARLHLREWPQSGARGTVLIVHGLGEHAGRYEAVAALLNESGWHAAGHDHRGHGRSGGARGVLPDDETLLRDLALVIDTLRGERAGPLILLGHSLGGLVAARFVAEALRSPVAAWSRPVDGLVLSSPALAVTTNPLQKVLLAIGGRFAPDIAVGNGLKPTWLSRDAAVVRAYCADPLVHDRIAPRLARFIVEGGPLVRSLAPRWRIPTLLLWAGADRCVAPRGSAAFAAAAPAALVSARCFEPLFHEIFNEPVHDEVFAALRAWLSAH